MAAAEPLWTLCLAGNSLAAPGELWSAWSLSPWTLVPLAAAAGFYAFGWVRAKCAAPSGAEGAAALLGFGLLALALVSPLCRLAATLASAHMVQHFILAALAPPLLLFGAPGRALRNVLPPALRVSPIGVVPATLGYGAVIWLWHLPTAYEASLASEPVHLLYYATLLGASLLFWRAVLTASAERVGAAAFALLFTLVHTGLLSALLTFAPRPFYPVMTPGALLFRLDPLEDQQLAGLVMWVPMGAVYLLAALLLVGHRLLGEGSAAPRAAPG